MYQTYTQADSMKNHWTSLEMLAQNETISFYIFKVKKAACLSMYQTYTQADSKKNHWNSLEILAQNENISFYIFKAKKSCLLEYVSNIYSSRQHEKPLNFIGNFGSNWDYLLLYIQSKKKLPAWVCIKHILKQTAWKTTELHWKC